jgi:hypothetical protein
MTLHEGKRFVLLLDCEANSVPQAVLEIAGEHGALLIARTVESALEFAQQYKPTHAVMPESQAFHEGKFLPALLLEFSPDTEVTVLAEDFGTLTSAAKSGVG